MPWAGLPPFVHGARWGSPAVSTPGDRSRATSAGTRGRGFGLALDGRAGPSPTAFLPPVVPWITGMLYRTVGHRYLAALLLQCGIGALVPPLTGALAAVLFGGAVGALAGWLA